MNFGCNDGSDNIQFSDGWAVLDVAAHEFTHGVIYFTSELNGSWPSTSLNEGLSDIMGAMVDPDWLFGENVSPAELAGDPACSLSDPPSLGGYPDR